MSNHPYDLADPIGTVANLGLIVLQTDQTLEHEAALFQRPGLARYVSRVPSGAEVTPETLRAMADELPRAAGLLPPSIAFDVVGYGCTSGTMAIGADRVSDLIRANCSARHVTNPLSALLAACEAMQIARMAVLTPYIASVATPLCDQIAKAGVTVTGQVSFGEESEARVARISEASIIDGALAAIDQAPCEAVFLSCTNLRCFDLIPRLEAESGKTVLSSNQVLFWHMAQLAGVTGLAGPGQLFAGRK